MNVWTKILIVKIAPFYELIPYQRGNGYKRCLMKYSNINSIAVHDIFTSYVNNNICWHNVG